MKSNTGSFAEFEMALMASDSALYRLTPAQSEILALIDKFGQSGQSGGSAYVVAPILGALVTKLCLGAVWEEMVKPRGATEFVQFKREVLRLVEKFKAYQSPSAAETYAQTLGTLITNLCLQRPICPMTGLDNEWVHIADERVNEPIYQNCRCGPLFKLMDNRAYYLDAIAWKTDSEGGPWSGNAILPDGSKLNSRQYVKSFPFTPKTFIVDVIEVEVAPDDFEFYIKDVSQLDDVFAYYDRYDITPKQA